MHAYTNEQFCLVCKQRAREYPYKSIQRPNRIEPNSTLTMIYQINAYVWIASNNFTTIENHRWREKVRVRSVIITLNTTIQIRENYQHLQNSFESIVKNDAGDLCNAMSADGIFDHKETQKSKRIQRELDESNIPSNFGARQMFTILRNHPVPILWDSI